MLGHEDTQGWDKEEGRMTVRCTKHQARCIGETPKSCLRCLTVAREQAIAPSFVDSCLTTSKDNTLSEPAPNWRIPQPFPPPEPKAHTSNI